MGARSPEVCFTQSQQNQHLGDGKGNRSSGWILKAKFCSYIFNTHYLLSPRNSYHHRGGRGAKQKEQKNCVPDECPERWEAMIEDFCNTEADTNA